jgi:hypothetical protein
LNSAEIRLGERGQKAVSAIKDEGKVRVEIITVISSPAAVHRFVRWPSVAVIFYNADQAIVFDFGFLFGSRICTASSRVGGGCLV